MTCVWWLAVSALGYSRKNPNRWGRGGGWGHTLLKITLGIFRFVTLLLEILEEMKLHHRKFLKIVFHSLEFPSQNPRPMEIPHDFLLITSENSTSFFLTSRMCTLYFFNTPGNSNSSTPCLFFFSGICLYSSTSFDNDTNFFTQVSNVCANS